MEDKFFSKKNCDRCFKPLDGIHTMSWFTEDVICMTCSDAERKIRQKLPDMGRTFEGCGYIPVN